MPYHVILYCTSTPATFDAQGENWADNLKEEKILSELPWDALVYNYYKNLQENAMSKNVALRTLQVIRVEVKICREGTKEGGRNKQKNEKRDL